jgi:DNA-binding MarR family transcriptional regulator
MIAKTPAAQTSRVQSPAHKTDELTNLIAICRRLLWSTAHEELLKHGETIWGWQVLANVERCSPITQCDLAFATAQHPAAVSRMLAELESIGLVRRRRDASDRRRVLVSLTRKGKIRYGALHDHVYRSMSSTLATLSDFEQQQHKGLLGKIVDNAGSPTYYK